MAEPSIFTAREQAFLRELVRSRVDFMIVGLAAAALQGAPAVTQDIDLWFRDLQDPGIRKALQAVGGSYVPSIGLHPPILAGSAVALFDVVLHMHGLESFDKELKHAIEVPVGGVAVKVLAIERIIASKEAANRDKDRLVLPVLRDAAAAIREEKQRRRTPGKRRRK